MTIEQQAVEKLRAMPPEKQKEVLVFVESLSGNRGNKFTQAQPAWLMGGLE